MTPTCPICNQPPGVVLRGWGQAFCDNAECPCVSWDPQMTPEENARMMQVLDLGQIGRYVEQPAPDPSPRQACD